MKCPRCGFEQPGGGTECMKCGIVYAKYLTKREMSGRSQNAPETVAIRAENYEVEEKMDRFKELFLYAEPGTGAFHLTGRAVILAVLVFWGMKFVFSSVGSNYAGGSFLHLVNLPFHEAGHILFRIFGEFMTALGGSLTQLLVPLVCLLTFLLKTRDTFGASVSLWWLGENLIDLAPYINDARDLNLVLLGGVTGKDVDNFHDWEYILRKLGLLEYDHLLAKISHVAGALLMACAVMWGGVLWYQQFTYRRRKEE